MADLPLPPASLALSISHWRGWWDTILALMVMALANFWEALPHLIQLGGLVVVCLTAVQKLIELGWIRNPLRRKQEQSDDPR
ncbi:hypothetical protein [Novosphingobium humi]|uniref:hypothetical protein n=1 Tax=Novosphingobium humi TaxID=2282397 RepID=UPI0025B26C25|nr:hypothetical protein [Novosphingobium humi]WJS98207.1 hypothetical protein NYQ05_13890 [Novosphingobium humi]